MTKKSNDNEYIEDELEKEIKKSFKSNIWIFWWIKKNKNEYDNTEQITENIIISENTDFKNNNPIDSIKYTTENNNEINNIKNIEDNTIKNNSENKFNNNSIKNSFEDDSKITALKITLNLRKMIKIFIRKIMIIISILKKALQIIPLIVIIIKSLSLEMKNFKTLILME